MTKKTKRILFALWIAGLIMTLAVGLSIAAQDKMDGLSSQDSSFVKDAAMGGMMEVELGKLAGTQASSEDVKNFGQRMVTDHSKANDELKSIADKKGIALPGSVNKSQQKIIDKLSKKNGADFDRAYMKDMVKDHKMDVKAFEKQSKKGTDPDLKAFAAKTLPTLQDHLQSAQQINDQLKSK